MESQTNTSAKRLDNSLSATQLRRGELAALIQVGKTMSSNLDLDAVLETVMEVTTETMRVEAASLILIDEESDDLVFHVACGQKAASVKPIRMKKGVGIVGWVIENNQPLMVNDVSKDPRFYVNVDESSGFNTSAILCVPLATNTKLWGAFEVLNKLDDSDFSKHDLELCEAIAGQAAIAIENAVLHKDMLKQERLATVGQTVAELAHCIKNVLNAVKGGSYIVNLGLKKEKTEQIAKGWEIVSRNNAFLQELVMNMLTYSKERVPSYEPCMLNDLVSSLCESVAAKAGETAVEVTWVTDPDVKESEVDPVGIKRALLNLISNAVDACAERENARVEVSTMPVEDGKVCIKVSDNGEGISERDCARIFKMFYSSKGSKGTGLGLAVTRKIIEEHGGDISVASIVGQGTTFTIVLPLKRPQSADEGSEAS